jgi:hydroxymethylbilane synthase
MAAPARLTIATRESRLALWQAEHVQARLRALYPQAAVELLGMTTSGDQILDRTLSKVGGKGLFVKELETALADGRAELAVHSLKDLPVDMPDGFELCAVLERADPRDAFVSNSYDSLAALPAGAVVGTSSLRREAQLRERYPQLLIKPLRGNIDTRLAKLDRGDFDAVILAAAGLERLGLGNRIRAKLSPDDSLPAVAQGALGIEIRSNRDDVRQACAALADPATTACALAERTVSRALGGSCQVPLAAYAEIDSGVMRLRALVATPDGTRILRAERSGSPDQAHALGLAVADDLLQAGAAAILAELA